MLVKFTASWCGPCKREIPGMLSAYEKYHDKGFEIVSIYIWDKLSATKKIIEDEKNSLDMSFGRVDRKSRFTVTRKKVRRFRCTDNVIDCKEGKIIDTDARGEHLQKKLAELFPDGNYSVVVGNRPPGGCVGVLADLSLLTAEN